MAVDCINRGLLPINGGHAEVPPTADGRGLRSGWLLIEMTEYYPEKCKPRINKLAEKDRPFRRTLFNHQ
jgi:hypothetical protein